MNFNFGSLKFNRILFLWLCVFCVNIITLIIVNSKIRSSAPTLALHYNVVFGVDWYGAGKNLYSIPIIALFISALNLTLYRFLQKQKAFLAFLVVFVTILIQLILLISVLFLARVN